MIREDYIMRMIEQLVKVLDKILFNKETENYNEALNDIEASFNKILGLDYNLINSLSGEDIISLLQISKEDTTIGIKYIIIAKLLKEKAEIKNLHNKINMNSVSDYHRPLNLFLEGILKNKNIDVDLSNYYKDVEEIVAKIDDLEISKDIRLKLINFYELIGKYDKAKNELSKLKGTNYPKT